ncbi:ABC transporter ATP-binding protein [Priestia megaterium]|nr:ABC transporter ATP-binding protein [Priestia megaterium]
MTERILAVNNLTKQYDPASKAVNAVSLSIDKGECLGIVGESGSGKSTLAKCLLQLENATRGEIFLHGQPLHQLKKRQLQQARMSMQAVFQNPAASFNPKLTIIDSLLEPLTYYKKANPSFLQYVRKSKPDTGAYLLEMVKLPSDYLYKYPHELSGGQKQRVAIARAISTEPSLLILDEPTASLDVSIQAKILNLLKDLQETLGMSYMFISHDLAAVKFMSNRILVMKDGNAVDECRSHDLFSESRHPYTKQLVHVYE